MVNGTTPLLFILNACFTYLHIDNILAKLLHQLPNPSHKVEDFRLVINLTTYGYSLKILRGPFRGTAAVSGSSLLRELLANDDALGWSS